MFAKRGLEIWFEKIRFEWKGFGRIKYLPFIVDYILLPLFVIVCTKTSVMYREEFYFSLHGEYFIPFMSIWWIILILQEYVEGVGSEVIRIYDKNKLPELFFYFCIYLISLIPIFVFSVKSVTAFAPSNAQEYILSDTSDELNDSKLAFSAFVFASREER